MLKTGLSPITTVMRRLLTGYAVTLNHRYKCHGHLFLNRYKSILCREETYLLELVRYIHLNPLRAGPVPNLEKLKLYRYCGHSRLMGFSEDNRQDTEFILNHFGRTISSAGKNYAVRELGYSVTSVATRLSLGQPAVSRAVQRGERLVQEHNYSLDILEKSMKS